MSDEEPKKIHVAEFNVKDLMDHPDAQAEHKELLNKLMERLGSADINVPFTGKHDAYQISFNASMPEMGRVLLQLHLKL